MESTPANIDVLMTEGTNLGTENLFTTEVELERGSVELLSQAEGRAFSAWSAWNTDCTVTRYGASKRIGQTLVAEVVH